MMKKEIIVKGDQNIILSVSLLDILNQISKPEKYIWKILWLEATGRLIEGNILDFEKEINNSNTGYTISFPELTKFAKSVDQIIEIVLIGSTNIDYLRRYKSDQEMKKYCDYYIELVDSSYWKISSIDEEFILSVTRNLPGVIPC